MDPVERLASDLQTLKQRFDDLVLKFAVGEEREKRVDDKLDALTVLINLKLSIVEKSMGNWNKTGLGLLVAVLLIFITAIVKLVLGGGI